MPNAYDSLSVIEIIRRIPGYANASFLCKCEDGKYYVITGYSATSAQAPIAEWVAANLAKQFGLPLPPFHIASVPAELTQFMPQWQNDLSAGYVFASLFIENAAPLSAPQAHSAIDIQQQKSIYLFDYWLNNASRSFINGCANIIYDFSSNKHYLLNHRHAFSSIADQHITDTHIYAPLNRKWVFDLIDRHEGEQKIAKISQSLENILTRLPQTWSAGNSAFIGHITHILQRTNNHDFWSNLS